MEQDRRNRVRCLADRLLGMIELAVQETEERMQDKLRHKGDETEAAKGKKDALLDMGEVKQITAALKEILLLQNEEGEESASLSVVLEGEVEKYAG